MRSRVATQPGLPDYLNYRRFVAPGIIELADGAFLTAFEYWGPDQEYADYAVMAQMADQLNHDPLSKLGNGWMFEANSIRVEVTLPPADNHCPEPTSALIFAERAATYAQKGKHYEPRHVLAVTYLPPASVKRAFSEWFFVGRRAQRKQSRRELLAKFQADLRRMQDALSQVIHVIPFADEQLVHFLDLCVTGEDRPVGFRRDNLQYVIGATAMAPHGGIVGQRQTRVVGVLGYPHEGTYPQMFARVLNLPFPLRLTQRFIFLSPGTAIKTLSNKLADWIQINAYNVKRIFWSVFRNMMDTDPNDKSVVSHNTDAEQQAESTEREITAVREGQIREGFFSFTVVVQDHEAEVVQARALEVVAGLNQLGFQATIETDNAADALGGSWPGHGTRNVRKPLLNTRHFAQLWPTSSVYRGEERHPSPLYPEGSGPLLITTTTGDTPFFFTPGQHFMIIGGTGRGKTFALNDMCMAFLQYQNAQVNLLDRDSGGIVPTLACGGQYYDGAAITYTPLAHIDEEAERVWAARLCTTMAKINHFVMTPQARLDIETALLHLSTAPIQHRTMTGLLAQLQTHEKGLKAALSFYTLGNGGAILDGRYSARSESHWESYDMERVLGQGPEIAKPVLLSIIHRMERRMDGRPTLLVAEEGWQLQLEEMMEDYFVESSANMRKKNVSLGLVLHAPGNLKSFDQASLLLANIHTFIFLHEPLAMSEGPMGMKADYQALGLGEREIRMIAEELRPRMDYYVVDKQKNQRRVFQLQSGPLETTILGVNGRDHAQRVQALREQYGNEWLPVWLSERGQPELAAQWQTYSQQQKEAA